MLRYDQIKTANKSQLLNTHRRVCQARGKEWDSKKKSLFLFKHSYYRLYWYHMEIIEKLKHAGIDYNTKWENPDWRGDKIGIHKRELYNKEIKDDKIRYSEL